MTATLRTTTRARLELTGLDARELPSATATFNTSNRVLDIQGTYKNDKVVVVWRANDHGNQFEVRQGAAADNTWSYPTDGSVKVFPGNVAYIQFDGKQADDYFRNYTGTRCRAIGGDGRDTLIGSQAKDILLGGPGNDYLDGGGEDDVLSGDGVYVTPVTYQNDGPPVVQSHLIQGTGNDTIYGGGGNDLMYGDYGDDNLFGQAGNDKLEGNMGNDYLEGGSGADRLNGGKGWDYVLAGMSDIAVTAGPAENGVFSRPDTVVGWDFPDDPYGDDEDLGILIDV